LFFIGIDTGGQPIGDYRHRVFVDLRRVGVIAGERVPIGDEMVALVDVLQLDPVFERALVIAEVQATRRAHSANDSFHNQQRLYRGLRAVFNNGADFNRVSYPKTRQLLETAIEPQ